jgi:hypothetical protein
MMDFEKLSAARKRIEALSTVLDWHTDLLARIRRAQLIFELIDFEHCDHELELEVRHHLRVCRQLTWPSVERRAAA